MSYSGSTPNVSYIDGASSREMDVQNNGTTTPKDDPRRASSSSSSLSSTSTTSSLIGSQNRPTSGFDWADARANAYKKKKVTVVSPTDADAKSPPPAVVTPTPISPAVAVAGAAGGPASPRTSSLPNGGEMSVVDLSDAAEKGAVASSSANNNAMDKELKIASNEQLSGSKSAKYSKKQLIWFGVGAILVCAAGAALGVGFGLFLHPQNSSRGDSLTNSTDPTQLTPSFTPTPTTTTTLLPTSMPTLVPTATGTAPPPLPTSGTCSNYTFISGSAFQKPIPNAKLNRLEPVENGRPMMGFSIEWGADLPSALVQRLNGRAPAIVGGFAHLINATYWEQDIIEWYAWQVALATVPNYNLSNPATNYTNATNPPAILLIALMPRFSMDLLTDATADAIAVQMARINDKWGVPVMLRFGHEMNGNWNSYSQRPLGYVQGFRKMATAIRKRTNLTAMVWAPNFGSGYPYNSPNSFTPEEYSAEWNATDTNKDGLLDGKDDPYTPYWPGAEYVDWVGMSAYWLSYTWPMGKNEVTPPDYLWSIVNGTNYEAVKHEQPPWDIYEMFCKRYNKPFILPESGAAYYLNYYNHYNTTTGDYEDYIAAPGPGELRLKRTWWNHAWNAANTVRWPLLKAIVNFEESKIDERGNTTYTLTFNTTIKNAFLLDVANSGVKAIWADSIRGYDCAGRVELDD